MSMFRIGDIVVCVNNEGVAREIDTGQIFEVVEVDYRIIVDKPTVKVKCFNGIIYWFLASRFELFHRNYASSSTTQKLSDILELITPYTQKLSEGTQFYDPDVSDLVISVLHILGKKVKITKVVEIVDKES